MTILVDASVLVAIATGEPEAEAFAVQLRRHTRRFCASTGLWESARAVCKLRTVDAGPALAVIERVLRDFDIGVAPVGEAETRLALEAHDRYGKGNHPAQLNMGDCFAYACAKANDARLLYKGSDFAETDLA